MFIDSDFVGFMFYRDSLIKEKTNECLEVIRRGRSISNVDFGLLTPDEKDVVLSKVKQIAQEKGYSLYGNTYNDEGYY